MEIHVTKQDGSKIIAVQGRIDTTTAPTFERTLLKEMENESEVRVDLQEVAYVSSAGLRAFLNGQKFANKKKMDMILLNVADTVMEVLEMTGFVDILTIE